MPRHGGHYARLPTPAPSRGTFRPQVMGRSGMVTAGHYLAAWWGTEMLRRGGNAADAGVAAGLVLNVVHNDMASLSGVAPVVYYDGVAASAHTISGVGRWPASIDSTALMEQYGAEFLPGIMRTVVPAAADAWITALDEFGTMDWHEVAEYAVELAHNGFPVHDFMAENIALHLDDYRSWPENSRIFLRNGDPPSRGDVVVQSDLGSLFDRLNDAEATARANGAPRADRHGAVRDRFYRGDVADAMVSHYRKLGCLLSHSDLAEFRVGREDPIAVDFHGSTVWACGPWSQGPVLPMALNILRNCDLGSDPHDPTFYHFVVESLKLAFADLEAYCGDPDFVDVPMLELLTSTYGELRASLIDPERASATVPPYGDPRRGVASAGVLPDAEKNLKPPDFSEPDTTFVAVIDRFGNAFSATPSDSTFVNPIVPGLGVHMSRRGSQSRLNPSHPNSIEPRKRPRLTPNPVILSRDGAPYMSIGTPGSNCQPQAMLQVLLWMEVFGMSPQEAVEQPRVASYSFPETAYPYKYSPGLLHVEAAVGPGVTDELKRLGHRVEVVSDWSWAMGGVCVVKRDPRTGVLWGGADPRRETYTVAF